MTLADWGTRQVKGEKQTGTIAKVRSLIRLYLPDVLVLEDATGDESRRCKRIRALIEELALCGGGQGVRVALISVALVRRLFAMNGATTKDQIAGAVVEQLPDLAPLRPPPRKPWMREDDRMAVFDAAAFAIAYYNKSTRRQVYQTV